MLDSVVSIRRSTVHSEKPEEFRRLIERLYPFGRRLELFGRRAVEGWTVWGDQVPSSGTGQSRVGREEEAAETADETRHSVRQVCR
jgi:N6-adenosine-specific RNA methylase IME4